MKRSILSACLPFFIFAFSTHAEPRPIVELDSGFVLGAVNGKKWIPAEAAKPLLKGGEHYRVYSMTQRLASVTGSKPEPGADVCQDVPTVKLNPHPAEGVLAVGGEWNALPRTPKIADPAQPVYIDVVREFLGARGIRTPKIKISQIIRIDLDGDGEDEVLISATNYFTADDSVPSGAKAGSYSFVLVRRVVAGKVQTQLVVGEFYPKAKTFNAPNRYRVSAVLDLNGDGEMEVVVQGAYYEGGSTGVYRCSPAKIEKLLEIACGA